MKAKQVYIKVKENEENIECLHQHIKDLHAKIELLCKFIQEKHELKEEEEFLQKLELKELKKEAKEPVQNITHNKPAKREKKKIQRRQGGIKAVQQMGKIQKDGKREQVKLVIKPRRQGAPVQPKKRARRFRKA